jgi:hypothetical protein
MAINKFNAKNGLSVGVPSVDVIDSNANATFLSLSVTGNSSVSGSSIILGNETVSGNLYVKGTATATSFNSITGLATSSPLTNTATSALGTSTQAARADHTHQTDFSNNARYSTQATSAYQADIAGRATFTSQALSAYQSDKAYTAIFASQALSAYQADTAKYSNTTTFATQALSAYQSDTAKYANVSTLASQATSARQADIALYSNTTTFASQAASAYKADILATARTINGVSFNGSGNIEIECRLGTPIAAGATTTIGTAGLGDTIHITGTTTITSFGVASTGTLRTIIFDSANCTITHNVTSLILPGASNIVTNAGDSLEVVCENGASGYWRCVRYTPSIISSTELLYLDGASANIQTQLVNKEPAFGILPVTKGGTGLGTLTQDYFYKGNAANTIAVSTISENSSGRVLVGATDDGASKFQVAGQSSITNHTAASVRGLQLLNNTNTGTATSIDLAFATHDGTVVSYCSAIGATNISNTNGAYGSRTTYLTATGSGGLLLATTSPSSSIRF